MDKRVGTGHLILFADNSTTAEDGGSPMHAEERLADAGIWDTMTQGRQMAANHPPAKMREDSEYVGHECVQVMVAESGYRGGDRTMVTRGGTVLVVNANKDYWARAHQAIHQRLTANMATRTFEETSYRGGAPHLQGVLEERPIDGLRRTPATTSLAYSNYMERRGIWRVHRLMTRSVKVEDHVGDAVSEGEELGGRKYMAVLQRRRW